MSRSPSRQIDWDMVDLALDGFEAARARVDNSAPVAKAMYVSLTEAAWWAVAIDDELEQVIGYKSARNTNQAGLTVLGLRYARSALGHHAFFAAERRGGHTIPFTLPMTFTAYPAWLPANQLPDFGEDRNGKPLQERLRPFYEEHLARRDVRQTLASVSEWLHCARHQSGPGVEQNNQQ